MYRIAKQLHISHSIRQCKDPHDIHHFLDALALEMNCENAQNLISRIFLSTKSQFSEQALDRLFKVCQDIPTTDYPTKLKCVSKTIQNNGNLSCNTNTSIKNIKQSQAHQQMLSLNSDVLSTIGVYLKFQSLILLSRTCHALHEMIQCHQVLGVLIKNIGFSSDIVKVKSNCIHLTDKMLQLIYNNNCIAQPLHNNNNSNNNNNNCQKLNITNAVPIKETFKDFYINCAVRIATEHAKWDHKLEQGKFDVNQFYNYKVENCMCILHRLVKKITSIETGMSSISNCHNILINNGFNYDINWFQMIFSKVDSLYISSSWTCAFDHIPMPWIFGKNNGNNNNKNYNNYNNDENAKNMTINKTSKNIMDTTEEQTPLQIGASDVFTVGFDLDTKAVDKLSRHYEAYFTQDCNNNLSMVRPIKIIHFQTTWRHGFYWLQRLHNNFTTLQWKIGGINNTTVKFNSLSQFLDIFHPNCHNLILSFFCTQDYWHNNNNDTSITHQFFQVTKNQNVNILSGNHVVNDLDKSKWVQPSMNKLFKKHECENRSLPNIKFIMVTFDLTKNNDIQTQIGSFIKILNHTRLFQLLNWQNSVDTLRLNIFGLPINKYNNEYDINSNKTLNSMNQELIKCMKKCVCSFKIMNNFSIRIDIAKNSKAHKQATKMELFFNQVIKNGLTECCKQKNIDHFEVIIGGALAAKHTIECDIQIDKKTSVKRLVTSVTEKFLQQVINFWVANIQRIVNHTVSLSIVFVFCRNQ